MPLLHQPDEGDGVVIVDIPDEELTREEKTLSTVFSELEDNTADVLVKVYRVNEAGREAHCFDTGPDDLDGIEDRLRDAYGRGDYKLKAYGPTGEHGRKSIKKVVKLSLEVPKQPEPIPDKSADFQATLLEITRAMNENQQANITAQQNMMNSFREQQLESQLRMQELMIQMMGNKPEGPKIEETIALIKSLTPEQPNAMEMLDQVFNIQSKVQDMAQPSPETPLGQLTHGIDSLVKLASNSPKAGGPGGPSKPALPPGVQAANMPIQQPQQPPPQVQPQQPPPQVQQPQQPRQQSETGEPMNPFVKMEVQKQLRFLMAKAIDNKQPHVYAELIVEEMNPEFYPILVEKLGDNDEQALEYFAEIEPGILQFSDWFKQYAGCIREMFTEPEATEVDETGLNAGELSGDNSVIVDSDQNSVNHTTTKDNAGHVTQDNSNA